MAPDTWPRSNGVGGTEVVTMRGSERGKPPTVSPHHRPQRRDEVPSPEHTPSTEHTLQGPGLTLAFLMLTLH